MKQLTKNQAIASARAFIGTECESVIKMCDLVPHKSWQLWLDNFGNKLQIYKDKSLKIIKEESDSFNVNDLYIKSSYEIISSNSYWSLILKNDTEFLFWFIGHDGFLRVIRYSDDAWHHHKPLDFGPDILFYIGKRYLDDFGILHASDCFNLKLLNFSATNGYITSWPPEDKQILSILKENKIA